MFADNPELQSKLRLFGIGALVVIIILLIAFLISPFFASNNSPSSSTTPIPQVNINQVQIPQRIQQPVVKAELNLQREAEDLIEKIRARFNLSPFPFTMLNPQKVGQIDGGDVWKISVSNFGSSPLAIALRNAFGVPQEPVAPFLSNTDYLITLDANKEIANVAITDNTYFIGDNLDVVFKPSESSFFSSSVFEVFDISDLKNPKIVNRVQLPFENGYFRDLQFSATADQNYLVIEYTYPDPNNITPLTDPAVLYIYNKKDLRDSSKTSLQPAYTFNLDELFAEIEKTDRPLFEQIANNRVVGSAASAIISAGISQVQSNLDGLNVNFSVPSSNNNNSNEFGENYFELNWRWKILDNQKLIFYLKSQQDHIYSVDLNSVDKKLEKIEINTTRNPVNREFGCQKQIGVCFLFDFETGLVQVIDFSSPSNVNNQPVNYKIAQYYYQNLENLRTFLQNNTISKIGFSSLQNLKIQEDGLYYFNFDKWERVVAF